MNQLLTIVLYAESADEARRNLRRLTSEHDGPLFGYAGTYEHGTPISETTRYAADYPAFENDVLPLDDEAAAAHLREAFDEQAKTFSTKLQEVRDALAKQPDDEAVMNDQNLRHTFWALSPYGNHYTHVYYRDGRAFTSTAELEEMLEKPDDAYVGLIVAAN